MNQSKHTPGPREMAALIKRVAQSGNSFSSEARTLLAQPAETYDGRPVDVTRDALRLLRVAFDVQGRSKMPGHLWIDEVRALLARVDGGK